MWRKRWNCIWRNKLQRKNRIVYIFLLPGLIGTGGFVGIPFLDVFRRSCLEAVGSGFVGWTNYREVFDNRAFRLAAFNTAKFMFICLPLLLGLSLGLAVLFYGTGESSGWLETGFLLPMAVPAVSVAVFFQMIFDGKGWLNLVAGWLGLPKTDWLNCSNAFWVLVICYLWKNLGYDMLLWMTGLISIGKEQYEAAKVEGAGDLECFFWITLPQLGDTAFVAALLSFVNAFRVFREAYLLSGDYPHESIYMLQHLFNNWFVHLDIQKLTAAASMLTVSAGGVVFLFFVLQRRRG